MQANQIPFDHTVGTGIQQKQNRRVAMNKQTEVKVLVVSDKRERVEMEACLSTVMIVVRRALYHLLSIANGTRKITVIAYEKANVQNAVQFTVAFKGYRREHNTIYAQVRVEKVKGNKALVPDIENLKSVVVAPDLKFPQQEPQRRRVKAIVEQPVKHVEEAMSQANSEPVKQTQQEVKKEEQPITGLQLCLHNMLKVTKDKKTRQQLIALAAHIEHKGYEVNAGQFAKYAAAVGNYEFDRIIARVDEIHGTPIHGTQNVPREELDEALIERIRNIAKEELQKQGIDLSNRETVMEYVMAHKDEILKKAQEAQEDYNKHVIPEFAGPMHDELMKAIDENGNYGDYFIYGIVQAFGGRSPEHAKFSYTLVKHFDRDPRRLGEYVRRVLGKDKNFRVKDAVYVTADATRATGDIIQRGFELAGRGISYLFYAVADLIEKPVGGRPEYLKGVNLVKVAAKQKRNK